MKHIAAAVLISLLSIPLPAQQPAPTQQQVVQVECRDLSTSGNYLAANETVINGKACRAAGAPLEAGAPTSQLMATKTIVPPAPTGPVPPLTAPSVPAQQIRQTSEMTERPAVAENHSRAGIPRIYITPADGFQSYLAAAVVKKHVPAQIVQDQNQVDYILGAAPVQEKPESSGGKIARCLFLYCAGIEGSQTASVTLTDARTNVVVWAYNVRKEGSKNYQSSAEACAKHLKDWLEHTEN